MKVRYTYECSLGGDVRRLGEKTFITRKAHTIFMSQGRRGRRTAQGACLQKSTRRPSNSTPRSQQAPMPRHCDSRCLQLMHVATLTVNYIYLPSTSYPEKSIHAAYEAKEQTKLTHKKKNHQRNGRKIDSPTLSHPSFACMYQAVDSVGWARHTRVSLTKMLVCRGSQ